MEKLKTLLEKLNPQQKEAVLYFDSPLLVLAGAGSGKTRVITVKIAYMIEELHFPPERILAVTFTNKAAREMKERVEGILGRGVPAVISTFHSFCVRLIRAHSRRLGFSPDFLIVDEDDRKRVIKEVLKELNLSSDLYSPSVLSAAISNLKNGVASGLQLERVEEIFRAYNEKLKSINALDFDDLLLYGRELLLQEDLGEYYSEYFRYVLIDEYQDTNKVQYDIAKALTVKKGNICAVGDEDQCIYTWRGANIENILSFERDFKNAKVIKLEQNYRCSATILEAANAVIANNAYRKGKRLFTKNPKGTPIRLYCAESDVEEALYIVKGIKRLISKGIKPSEIAVFYRTNSLSRIVEDALRKEGVAYQIVGGLKFYERREIKDIIAYLRVALFEKDAISLFRVLNTPRRGLGSSVEEKLRKILEKEESNLEALKKLESALIQKKQRNSVGELIDVIELIREKASSLPPYDLIKFIVAATGYEQFLRKEYPEEWESRLENIRELGNTLQEFAEREGIKGKELYLEFLSTVTLSSDQDELEDSEKVTLMTVHASKGLEFDAVFLMGLEEGIFPHAKSQDQPEREEEERRLFYVALTRAKKFLSLSYSKKRRVFGSYRESEPSKFLKEIPRHLIREVKGKDRRVREAVPSGASKRPKLVFHPKFGKGVVKRVEGSGDTAKVTAFFANFGEKTIVMKFLKVLG